MIEYGWRVVGSCPFLIRRCSVISIIQRNKNDVKEFVGAITYPYIASLSLFPTSGIAPPMTWFAAGLTWFPWYVCIPWFIMGEWWIPGIDLWCGGSYRPPGAPSMYPVWMPSSYCAKRSRISDRPEETTRRAPPALPPTTKRTNERPRPSRIDLKLRHHPRSG